MRTKLFGLILLGVSGAALAHSDSCEYSSKFDIKINQQHILFSRDGGDSFEFKDKHLLINGERVELDQQQLQASQQFQAGARAMVPKVANLAVDALELGVKASSMVLTSLFGDDRQAQQDLIAPINALSEKIKSSISHTEIDTAALEKTFESEFADQFEILLETALTKYSGKLIGNVINSIFSGDGEEVKDLEFRMENMEHEVEKYVAANSKEIEKNAELLCLDIAALDKFDTILESVVGYPQGGLIEPGNNNHLNLNSINWNPKNKSESK